MTDMTRFLRATMRLAHLHPSCTLTLTWEATLALIAALQMALRHPSMPGASGALLRSTVDSLIARLDQIEPDVALMLRRGDDPAHDVPMPSPAPAPVPVAATEPGPDLLIEYGRLVGAQPTVDLAVPWREMYAFALLGLAVQGAEDFCPELQRDAALAAGRVVHRLRFVAPLMRAALLGHAQIAWPK